MKFWPGFHVSLPVRIGTYWLWPLFDPQATGPKGTNYLGYQNDGALTSQFGMILSRRDFAEVKKLTTRPVVGVGRFTSPDMMVSQIRRGVLDFIGAARPSIADPWLPRKIAEGREDEIRECIGCNICRAHNNMGVPIRCTQNPTMGEEYRRGWHPERVPAAKGHAADSVLVVGGGPAGLECAMTLGKRGYRVMLAEARRELGGRVALESRLPGLSSWARVRDYRTGQIGRLPNVEVFLESRLSAADPRRRSATSGRKRACRAGRRT